MGGERNQSDSYRVRLVHPGDFSAAKGCRGMLERTARQHRQAVLRARDVRHKQRIREGKVVAPVEVDGDVLWLVIKTGWLSEAHAADRAAIG